eukprot:TRINITY_DN37861_c0_g1_i1.p2 TRINITY_DN37861_c0_g1~~TRINITY_DN37861_c0_g1_i1.p2  ORF type:complete len:133 (-),score=17.85 TRINITY_DN37861_c0_g1_i1:36-434(-)
MCVIVLMSFFFLMIRRPPRSTHCISSAASDVYKRQERRGCPGKDPEPPAGYGHARYRDAQDERPAGARGAPETETTPPENPDGEFAHFEGRGDDPPGNPVSYTHLRAHETRHDLVCRLLLEKKNIRDQTDSK